MSDESFEGLPVRCPTISDVVGHRVRALRRARGWNVDDLAERCVAPRSPVLTPNSLYAMENGRRKANERTRQITVDELVLLAKVFEVAPGDLLALECAQCHDNPPPGFACTACGAR